MRKLLTLAIPLVLGVGLLAAFINDPDDGQNLTAPREQGGAVTDTTLPAVIETPEDHGSTSSTVVPETTSTTAAPATTSTTVKASASQPAPRPAPRPVTPTTQAPAPAPTQAAAPKAVDCGTGSASAQASLARDPASGAYMLAVKIVNDSSKAIEIDTLVVAARYGPETKRFALEMSGRRVEARPGVNEFTMQISESASTVPPDDFEITEFRFHTAGIPECTSR